MDRDPFEEYLRQGEPARRDLGYAWQTAVGLQTVDDLQPSQYLIDTARRNIEGEISLDSARALIHSYYEENRAHETEQTEEADKVSVRIAQLLSERAFVFSPEQYLSIHKRLFSGIYDHAGKIRDYNISKKEWVLGGDTVLYGGAFQKQDIGAAKQDIQGRFSYANVLRAAGCSPKTISHAQSLLLAFGHSRVFGRSNAIQLLDLSPSAASVLLKKLLDCGVIETATGMGKGKYKFSTPQVCNHDHVNTTPAI